MQFGNFLLRTAIVAVTCFMYTTVCRTIHAHRYKSQIFAGQNFSWFPLGCENYTPMKNAHYMVVPRVPCVLLKGSAVELVAWEGLLVEPEGEKQSKPQNE